MNIAKRLGAYVRGFAAATKLGPQDLGAVYLLLAFEQLELAAKPERLTFELWQAASAAVWTKVQELAAKPERLTFELWQAASAAVWTQVQADKAKGKA